MGALSSIYMSNFYIQDLNAVLIHIPKTGGTCIRKGAFKDVTGPDYGEFPNEWEQKFKFAFVREPIERFLSCVSMFQNGTEDGGGEPRRSGVKGFTLEMAIQILEMKNINFGGNRKTLEDKFLHHALPMTHPFNMLGYADYVGRFESLNDDFIEICRLCSLNRSVVLPVLHVSRRPLSISDLSLEQFKFLINYYQNDFIVAGYEIPNYI